MNEIPKCRMLHTSTQISWNQKQSKHWIRFPRVLCAHIPRIHSKYQPDTRGMSTAEKRPFKQLQHLTSWPLWSAKNAGGLLPFCCVAQGGRGGGGGGVVTALLMAGHSIRRRQRAGIETLNGQGHEIGCGSGRWRGKKGPT